MKNSYTIIAKVADRMMLADLLDAIEGYATSVEVSVTNNAPAPASAPKPAVMAAPKTISKSTPKKVRGAQRNPKRSKVNDAIRTAVSGGKASIAALKIALEEAGMSPASLSTGIAALTKSGEIERVGDGEYALKAA